MAGRSIVIPQRPEADFRISQVDVAFGSIASDSRCPRYVRYTPNSCRDVAAPRTVETGHVWTGAPGDRRKVDGASPSR